MAALRRQTIPELEDAAPLLGSSRAASQLQAFERKLREWWQITTSESFLTSPVSRRDLWASITFVAMGISFASDVILGEDLWAIALDVIACAAAAFLSFLPRGTLRCDVVVMCSFLLMLVVVAVAWGNSIIVVQYFYDGLVLAIIGIHSSLIMAFFALSTALLACMGHGGSELMLAGGLVVSALAVVMEHRGAVCVEAVRKNQAGTRDLLDKAGDGFCSLDPATGLVSSASPKLERTLGASQGLVGRHFCDFVMEADVRCVQTLCVAAQTGGLLQEDLVTCRVPGRDQPQEPQMLLVFEAKLLPHMVDNGELFICVQVQGEMRLQPTEDLRAGPAVVERTVPWVPPDADEQLSLSSLAYSMSQHTGQDSRRAARRARPLGAPHSVDASTQTIVGRPPLGAIGESAPRRYAAGSLRGHRQHGQVSSPRPRARSNTSQRLLPQFEPTPVDTVRNIVIDTMRGINARGRGCCAWHVLWKVIMREVYAQPCQPQFAPHAGFQCSRCLAMNERENEDGDSSAEQDDESCSFCGGPPAAQPGSGAVSSSGEVADAEALSRASSSTVPFASALRGTAPSSEAASVAAATLTEDSLGPLSMSRQQSGL